MNKLTTTAQNNMDDLTNKIYETKGYIPLESISTYSVLVVLEISKVVSFGGDGGSACKGTGEGSWGCGHAPFLDPAVGCMGVLIL